MQGSDIAAISARLKELRTFSDFSTAEVAERLHFSSLSYFSRYVQKHFGMSPSAYRRRL